MDPAAVADATKAQHSQVLAAEALHAALVALLPSAPAGAAQLLSIPTQHPPTLVQALQSQPEHTLSPAKHPAKRKAGRASAEEVTAAGPPRPPPIKHEVYEDLEEKFNQLQSEREPKRHRGNPKGYQIKSFCKNPACGKQLNGGRTNRCEHCGFDLASHRRNSQLERLIKSGPLTHSQVRTALRDAANEVHVRTGGKAVVLTLMYIEGGGPAPAQAIAYGKPAAAFVEARKELITTFETACRDYFQEPQAPGAPQQQLQQQQQHFSQSHPHPAAATPQHPLLGPHPAAAGLSAATAAVPPRPCTLGPSSQLLSAVNAAAAAASAAASVTACPGTLPAVQPPPSPQAAATAAAALPQPVDLDSVIAATLSDPAAAMGRCREARVSGDVLARLPQAMQLTVLMQAGLLAGEAATVVVELESRQRLQQLQLPATALPLAGLTQQLSQQQQLLQLQQQHHQPLLPLQPQQLAQPPLQQHAAAAAAALMPALPPAASDTLIQAPPPPPPPQHQRHHPADADEPSTSSVATAAAQRWGSGIGTAPMLGGASAAGMTAAAPGAVMPGPYLPATGSGLASSGAAAAAAAAAVHGGAMPLLGPMQAAFMAAVGAGDDGVLGRVSGSGAAAAAAAPLPPSGPDMGHHQQLQGLLTSVQGPPPGPPELQDFGAVEQQGMQAAGAVAAAEAAAATVRGPGQRQPLQPQLL